MTGEIEAVLVVDKRLRMAEGLGTGAGLALLAVPMVKAFTFTQAQFQRI